MCLFAQQEEQQTRQKVKNCVLMQDTIVGEGTKLEYIISDKNVKITDEKELKGDEAFPVFVAKGQVV